jgi:hypothetical protein
MFLLNIVIASYIIYYKQMRYDYKNILYYLPLGHISFTRFPFSKENDYHVHEPHAQWLDRRHGADRGSHQTVHLAIG